MEKAATRKINQGITILLFAFILISIGSYWSITNQVNARKNVINSQSLISAVEHILLDLQNAELGQRGFDLTNSDTYLTPFELSVKSIPLNIKSVRANLDSASIQMERIDSIERIANMRIAVLQKLVESTQKIQPLNTQQIQDGNLYMATCRGIIERFVAFEKNKLAEELNNLDASSSQSSTILLFTGLISLLIASGFYIYMRKDMLNRVELEMELKHKDHIITKRIQATQEIASKIANGDLAARITDDKSDELGSLTISLNEMASSLENAFNKVTENEWKQSGIALLNESLSGNKLPEAVSSAALSSLIEYCGCTNGAFYIYDSAVLKMHACHGFEFYMDHSYEIGEGIIGQAYVDHKTRVFQDSKYVANCANGPIRINHVFILPLINDNECIGVIELGSFNGFSELHKIFLEESGFIIALELTSALSRMKVQAILEEMQAQSEELQSQHSELENLNAMLEAHTQQLQVSEEELRIQQEELLQINQELEERSKQLEEKNEIVAFRNIEIQKKAQELETTTRYKSEFMANMSHELRTPLNSILILSRLLVENLEGNLTNEQIDSARVIERSGSSLLHLIDEILDLSKIEAGKMKLDYHYVSLDIILSSLYGMFRPIVVESGLKLSIEVDENVPKFIEIDQLRLEQILRNFLSNAVKFTSAGDIKLKVNLDHENPHLIHFVVEDTGIGIENKNLKLIFESFQQADGSTSRKFGGTGLGLSISSEIARLFGGEIKVKSELNVGSTFTLIIPVNYSNKSDVVKVLKDDNLFHEELDHLPTLLMHNIPDEINDDRDNISDNDKVILIVEDDTNFAKGLLKFVHQFGYKGVVVVSGDLAVMAAEKYHPLVILLDIKLPKMDGWQVMDELKGNEKTRYIPVHIMSAHDLKVDRFQNGPIDFINKSKVLKQVGVIFDRINKSLNEGPRKVLIVEESWKHAMALSFFLSKNNINCVIKHNVDDGVDALLNLDVECVILETDAITAANCDVFEFIKSNKGLESLSIIVFAGTNISTEDELILKQYVDAVFIKTTHSFQRVLDEVAMFLHLVEENRGENRREIRKLGRLEEVLDGKVVLIADDDVRNIFFITNLLESYNMTVVSAMDGKEALQQLRINPNISIVLMDMMMPEMDGYDSIREIRKDILYSRLPIIAVTAKTTSGDAKKCIAAGASDYISKPVDKDQLLSLLRVWLYE